MWTYNSIKLENSVGVSRTRSEVSSYNWSVNQANLSPNIFDLMACPNFILSRLLYRFAFFANAFVRRLFGCLHFEMSFSKLVGGYDKLFTKWIKQLKLNRYSARQAILPELTIFELYFCSSPYQICSSCFYLQIAMCFGMCQMSKSVAIVSGVCDWTFSFGAVCFLFFFSLKWIAYLTRAWM